MRRAAGLLTRGSLPRRLPGSREPSGVVAERASPLTAAGPSRTCTGVPSPLAGMWRESSIAFRGRPRARARPRRSCSPTRGRSGTRGSRTRRGGRASSSTCPRTGRRRRRCSTTRSGTGGRCSSGSRPTGRRSAIRPRADTNAALRRLTAAGARIGVFSDAPRELADLALAHAGAARQVEAVGTLAEVAAALGAEAVVVRSREELAELR